MSNDDFKINKIYTPPPAVIRERKGTLRWLQDNKFCDEIIFAVMDLETIKLEVVERLHLRFGSEEAERRLLEFLE